MSGGAKNLIRMGAKRWGREKLEILNTATF